MHSDIANLPIFEHEGSFFMVNSIKLRDEILNSVSSSEVVTARQNYNRWVLPKLLLRACYPVFQAENRVVLKAHNTPAVTFDMTIDMRCRSPRDFFEIVTHPEFESARQNKLRFMERTTMTMTTTSFPVLDLSIVILLMLLISYQSLTSLFHF
jgi:hypothetical protein